MMAPVTEALSIEVLVGGEEGEIKSSPLEAKFTILGTPSPMTPPSVFRCECWNTKYGK